MARSRGKAHSDAVKAGMKRAKEAGKKLGRPKEFIRVPVRPTHGPRARMPRPRMGR